MWACQKYEIKEKKDDNLLNIISKIMVFYMILFLFLFNVNITIAFSKAFVFLVFTSVILKNLDDFKLLPTLITHMLTILITSFYFEYYHYPECVNQYLEISNVSALILGVIEYSLILFFSLILVLVLFAFCDSVLKPIYKVITK